LFNAKLTTRIAKKLNLTGAYKYNDRDNRTPVNIYQYADAGEAAAANASFPAGAGNPLGVVLAQNANANRPYGTKLNQLNFDADYALGGGQWVKGGYDFQKIDRACHGSWIDCADVACVNDQNTRCAPTGRRALGRTSPRADTRIRRGGVDHNEAFLALVPCQRQPAVGNRRRDRALLHECERVERMGTALGFTTTTGNMNMFFPSNNALANAMCITATGSATAGAATVHVADRNRDKVRVSNWQASVRGRCRAGDLNRITIPMPSGLQDAKGWAGNFIHLLANRPHERECVLHARSCALHGRKHLRRTAMPARSPMASRACGADWQRLRRLHDPAATQQQQQAGSVPALVVRYPRRREHRQARPAEAGLDLLGI
jgi:hypothetical protein